MTDSLDDLVVLARHLRSDARNVTEANLVKMERLIGLLRYQFLSQPANRREAETREVVAVGTYDGQTCCKCDTTGTLYHIWPDWYCLACLPLGITFPIGLHGDDYFRYKERNKLNVTQETPERLLTVLTAKNYYEL